MNVKIIEMTDRYIKLEITDITYAIANMLRRTLINDIPKLAIDKVKFHHGRLQDQDRNSYDSITPLFDEIIALRLGLVPLPTDLTMKFKSECTHPPEESCPSCTVLYSMSKFGPATVYSGDLIPIGNVHEFEPVEKLIPIVELKEKQAILIEAEAILGTAKEHAKWQVTSGVAYRYYREYIVPKSSELGKKYMKYYPKNIARHEGKNLIITNIHRSPLDGELYSDKSIKYKEDETHIILQFETDGSLSAKTVLMYAVERLQKRLGKIKASLSG